MTTLKIQTTLTKTFKNGNVSKWVFGQLSTGVFGAKNIGAKVPKKKVFSSLQELDKSIEAFKKFGYSNQGSDLIKQLALAV